MASRKAPLVTGLTLGAAFTGLALIAPGAGWAIATPILAWLSGRAPAAESTSAAQLQGHAS